MTAPGLLLVEADILVRHPLAEYLRQCGFTVYEVVNSEEARHLIDESPQSVDFVLADAAAPRVAGFSLAGWIRNSHPQIQVILAGTVARATEIAGDLCEEEGPNLAKPYDHRQVLHHIRRLIAARQRSNNQG